MRDPAAVASWAWPARTYPERMASLEAVGDARFRDDLLLTMDRRLAVARAVPVARKILSVPGLPEDGDDPLLNQIQSQRSSLAGRPEVLLALDRFLYHAGLGPLLVERESSAEEDLER